MDREHPYPAGKVCPLCGEIGVPCQHVTGGIRHLIELRDGVPGPHPPELRECCGCLLSWPWDSPEHYEAQYDDLDYHRDACLKLGIKPQYERFDEHREADKCRLDWLRMFAPVAQLPVAGIGGRAIRILDVGASNGALVAEAISRGAFAIGIEPSDFMVKWAWTNHAVPMILGTWRDTAGQWDLITATDVIEHLLDPIAFLKRMRLHTRRLYLETPEWRPDEPSFAWRHVKPAEHPFLLSEAAARALVERGGWKVCQLYRPIETKMALLLTVSDRWPVTDVEPR